MLAVYGKYRRDYFAGWILYLTIVQLVFVGTNYFAGWILYLTIVQLVFVGTINKL